MKIHKDGERGRLCQWWETELGEDTQAVFFTWVYTCNTTASTFTFTHKWLHVELGTADQLCGMPVNHSSVFLTCTTQGIAMKDAMVHGPKYTILAWGYIELKMLEKEKKQDGLSDLPLFPGKRKLKTNVKNPFLGREQRNIPRWGFTTEGFRHKQTWYNNP